ncbi:DUF4476 domain-containing protein [Hymenobacter lapidiphilus]|uniref:DUF4476 domain-containing protein n=1 Tax=Hymenobacter lapidiphilus TaxID=2608003 RepID=A0A7Y7PTB8_9BACT|nr:DUF4476 domain-containing protein [Hymenobacter lapidiphilus]NVO33439.1 DUF4476 domain-containing protein [Hymenobacter lapidiphilus]
MKRILPLLIGCLLLLGTVHAAPVTASISGERGLAFRLSLNGQPVSRGARPQIYLDQLHPGYYWADFYIPVGRGRGVNYRTQIFLADGFETNFVLVARPGFPPSLRTVSTVPLAPPVVSYPNQGPYPTPYPNNGYPAPGHQNHGYPNSGYPVPAYQLAPAEVDNLLQAIQRRPFDDARMAIMRDALRESFIESQDARRLIKSLSFDENRIETAKYLYSRVADRHNFYQVYDALVFNSSIQEVQEYVQSVR